MKKVSVFIVIGFVCLSATGQAALHFSDAKPEVIPVQMTFYDAENSSLEKALALHNLMNRMWETQEKLEEQARAQKNMKVQQKRMEAMERCNIRRLSEQFKNPKEVWEKMKDQYDRREKELTIFVNSAEGLTDEQREKMREELASGTFSDERLAETVAYWSIGNEILMDVYQNQDAWGARKSEKAPSFPLWEDQKYVFDKAWDDTYIKLNAYFGVPLQGRPVIGDEKYDYARREDVEKAHAAYVAMLVAQSPAKAVGLPAVLKQAPVAPKPLPPKEESLLYLESDDPVRQVYPGLPEPWQQYAKDDFKDIAPKGEMASDFSKGLVLKESAKHLTSSEQNNRLAVYQLLKKELNGAEKVADVVAANTERTVSAVRDELGNYIKLDDDFDFGNAKSFEKVMNQLKAQKAELVQAAEAQILREEAVYQTAWAQTEEKKRLDRTDTMVSVQRDNPSYHQELQDALSLSVFQQDKMTLSALKKDTDGRVFLTATNAQDIDRLLREVVAAQALENQKREWDKQIEEAARKPIDSLCINGGAFGE